MLYGYDEQNHVTSGPEHIFVHQPHNNWRVSFTTVVSVSVATRKINSCKVGWNAEHRQKLHDIDPRTDTTSSFRIGSSSKLQEFVHFQVYFKQIAEKAKNRCKREGISEEDNKAKLSDLVQVELPYEWLWLPHLNIALDFFLELQFCGFIRVIPYEAIVNENNSRDLEPKYYAVLKPVNTFVDELFGHDESSDVLGKLSQTSVPKG